MKSYFLRFCTERNLCQQRFISRLIHKRRAGLVSRISLCTKTLSSSLPSLTTSKCTITSPVPCIFKMLSFQKKNIYIYTWFEILFGSLVTLVSCKFLCFSRPLLEMFDKLLFPSYCFKLLSCLNQPNNRLSVSIPPPRLLFPST